MLFLPGKRLIGRGAPKGIELIHVFMAKPSLPLSYAANGFKSKEERVRDAKSA
jgi:hypothetical protein